MTNPTHKHPGGNQPEQDPWRSARWIGCLLLFMAGLVWWGARMCQR